MEKGDQLAYVSSYVFDSEVMQKSAPFSIETASHQPLTEIPKEFL